MNKNKSLHNLIHSLSANEKRFFKIYASRHIIGEENEYVKLFVLFDSTKVFDETVLNSKASKASFVKYFPAEKNYLYNMILDCLDAYHKESSIDRQISKFINIGRVLMEKKLDEQAVKQLDKARKLSIAHARNENLLTINLLLKKKEFSVESISSELLTRIHSEEDEMIMHLKKKLHYQHCYETLLFKRRMKGVVSDKNELITITTVYPYLLEKEVLEHDYFDEQVYYLISRLEYYRFSRNNTLGAIIVEKLFSVFENNKKKITGEYVEYFIYTYYAFLVMRLYKNTEEINKALYVLKHLDEYLGVPVNKSDNALCFQCYYNALTDIFLEQKSYKNIWRELKIIEDAIDLYEQHMSPTYILALHFNIGCIFIALGEYRLALRWLNKVNNVSTPFREDVFYDLRTASLITHLELGNEEVLLSLIKSANYYFKKYTKPSELQRTLIKYIKQLLKVNSVVQKHAIYLRLTAELGVLKENPNENRIFNDIDLLKWSREKVAYYEQP